MKVVCVGDCGIDHYQPSGERRFGGITANVARHARKQFPLDDEIHIVSCVGDDDGAELVLSSLATTDIDCHIRQMPGATPVQFIEIGENGEKNFIRYGNHLVPIVDLRRMMTRDHSALSAHSANTRRTQSVREGLGEDF